MKLALAGACARAAGLKLGLDHRPMAGQWSGFIA